ncbi:MAG: exopolysaccharide biosynthesis protein [Rickettsiales bacterium]
MSIPSGNIVEVLHNVLRRHKKKDISFEEIAELLEGHSLMLMIAVIAFPMAIPVPTPPGFTTLFGVPLCILTMQLILGYEKPKLPNFIAKRKIKTATFKSFVTKAEPLFNKLSKWFKPRQKKFLSKSSEKVMATLAFLCAVSVALPILFGNAIPCAAILIMALGMLYQDGVIVVVGMAVAIVGLTIASTVVFLFFWLGKIAFFKLFSDFL